MGNEAVWAGAMGGLERGTDRALTVGMGMRELDQRKAYQDAHIKMAQERAQIENATQTLQLEQAQKAKEAYDRPVDITTTPHFLSLPDDHKPKVLDYFVKNGFTDAAGKGKMGNIMEGVKAMTATAPLYKTYMEPVVMKKKEAVQAAWSELQMAKESGDDKKIEKLQVKFDKLNASYQSSSGSFDKHLEGLTKRDEARTLQQQKDDAAMARTIERNKRVGGSSEQGNSVTIYSTEDPNQSKKVFVSRGNDYEPPEGWTLTKPSEQDKRRARINKGGKTLDDATATSILKEAGGDKEKARKLAKERGYRF